MGLSCVSGYVCRGVNRLGSEHERESERVSMVGLAQGSHIQSYTFGGIFGLEFCDSAESMMTAHEPQVQNACILRWG